MQIRRSRIPQAGSLEENWFAAIFLSDDAALYTPIDFDETNKQITVPSNVSIARVFSTENVFLSYGDNPTAAGKTFLPAGIIEYYGVEPGKKFAAIRAGNKNGTIYISFGEYR